MMSGGEVEEFYDAGRIDGLAASMTGGNRTTAFIEVDNGESDLIGSQSAFPESLDRGGNRVSNQRVQPLGVGCCSL